MSERRCKDGGICHHGCSSGRCYRAETCSPLSGSGLGDDWLSIGQSLPALNIERDERFMGDKITDVETRILEGRSRRATTRIEVLVPLTPGELELLAASAIRDLHDGHVRAGGEPMEGFTLIALALESRRSKCVGCGTTEGKLHETKLYGPVCDKCFTLSGKPR